MVLSAMLSLCVITFLSGDLDPTARLVTDVGANSLSASGWLLFALGIFTGGLVVGTYVYVAHLEAKREE